MTGPERWLRILGHAMSAHTLYEVGHQARREASAKLFKALEDLLADDVRPTFTFLDDAVIYRTGPIHGLRGWSWGTRLAGIGVRRLEFTREATAEFVDDLLAELHNRLSGGGRESALPRWPGIEIGDVAVRNPDAPTEEPPPRKAGGYGLTLSEEVHAVRYAYQRVAHGSALPLDDVDAAVRSLSVAIRSEGEVLIPLLSLRSLDDHAALHAVNAAILSMTFSEWLGLAGGDIRAVGKAALLHDIGMARMPGEIFRRPELSDESRSRVSLHPEEGARLLVARSPTLDLAATAAYEHHLRIDGQGYPARRFHPELHYISRIIAVCGAYNALRSRRSYRPARDPAWALREIEAGAGTVFDPGLALAFVRMMRRWEQRVVAADQPA